MGNKEGFGALLVHIVVAEDFLVVCYDSKEIALNCGNMLRDCIKFPSLANDFSDTYLESANFELFFKFVELPTFDVASDAFSTFKVFVANPNKPREVKVILAKNNEKLLELLHNLSPGKGAEDEQFEEEEELIIKEIERVSRLPILES
nr:calcium-binding protein 39 [Quercus suber]